MRVPVLLQMSASECGAACLAMVLSYYGRHTKVAECRDQVGGGRDGSTALEIANAARRFGLQVKAYSMEPDGLEQVKLPVIVHWNLDHFVVVESWSPRRVTVVDPAWGRRRMTAEEFSNGFTGVVLALEPGPGFETRPERRGSAFRSWLKPILLSTGLPRLVAQILAASLLLQVLGLALPGLTKVLVDDVLRLGRGSLVTLLGAGLAVLAAAHVVTGYLRAALLLHLGARIDAGIMLGFFRHVLRLPCSFIQQRTSGDLLTRLGSNMAIREMLTNQMLSIVLDGAFVLVYLVILFAAEPGFALCVFAAGLLQVVLVLATGRRINNLMQRELSAAAGSQTSLVESLTAITTLKSLGAEDRALERWTTLFYRHLSVSFERGQLAAVINSTLTTLRTFAPVFLLWVAAGRVLDGSLSMGTLFALNALAISFLTPLASLAGSGQQLQLVAAHVERLSDILEAKPEQDQRKVLSAPRLSGRVELRDVSFRHQRGGPLVLSDLSFKVEPGQKVALVGRTGSGKSTLAKLLLGLYEPETGEVLYDGVPLPVIDRRSLRSQFGVVLQDSNLFSGSIRENIALRDPGLPLARVIEAARIAEIHEEIMRMPMGYETFLAEGGAGLSGGQRQRLSIARALVHRPAILLLDEATSHLDAATERRLEENLSRLKCTRIVIAHRLSTVRDADVILVLEQGRLIDKGDHEQLLSRNGVYAEGHVSKVTMR